METTVPDTSDEPRYTQGIMGDGAAILDDGVLLTVEQILDRLNAAATAPPAPDNIVALVDAYGAAEYWTHQMENDSNARIARDALLAAIDPPGELGLGAPTHWQPLPSPPGAAPPPPPAGEPVGPTLAAEPVPVPDLRPGLERALQFAEMYYSGSDIRSVLVVELDRLGGAS